MASPRVAQFSTAAANNHYSRRLTRNRLLVTAVFPACAAARKAATVNDDDINVLALVKGRERYIFLFDDTQRADALRTLGRFASNSELSFSWYDAAVLSQKVRQAGPVSKSLDRITLAQPDEQ